jgi:hypothetical protein
LSSQRLLVEFTVAAGEQVRRGQQASRPAHSRAAEQQLLVQLTAAPQQDGAGAADECKQQEVAGSAQAEVAAGRQAGL